MVRQEDIGQEIYYNHLHIGWSQCKTRHALPADRKFG